MSAEIVTLPARRSVEQAWQKYVDLVQEQRADQQLATDAAHQIRIAKAWAIWRDLYLAWGK